MQRSTETVLCRFPSSPKALAISRHLRANSRPFESYHQLGVASFVQVRFFFVVRRLILDDSCPNSLPSLCVHLEAATALLV